MRFYALDALRGLCALIVIFYHLALWTDGAPLWLQSSAFFHHGYYCVDFFFVLSGFVLAHSYGRAIDTPMDAFKFMVRRFGRVYPLHFFVLVLMALIVAASSLSQPFDKNLWQSFIANLFFQQTFCLQDCPSWNVPSWSVAVEFYCYGVFALILLFSTGRKKLIVFAAALLCFLGVATLALLSHATYLHVSANYLALFRCLYGFFGGVMAFYLYQSVADCAARIAKPAAHSSLRILSSPHFYTLMLTLLESAALIACVIFIMRTKDTLHSLAAPILFVCVVLVFAAQKGLVSKLFKTQPFQFLGAQSYGLYISHLAIALVYLASDAWREALFAFVNGTLSGLSFAPELAKTLYILVFLALMLTIAKALHVFVEAPLRALFYRVATNLPARVNAWQAMSLITSGFAKSKLH